ncbi:hypothetical protein DFP72DRAFT_858414 [Ephemerocybe angulata]|uniref:Uncharacterized protein n=1 Tax=Ephemerocybe angulata TaxID=980116 RepID=A0A8H6HCS9_9AGAR|nr:hypothetical protein DFP72DRAFT_858414 [Tulosesus angulatus]
MPKHRPLPSQHRQHRSCSNDSRDLHYSDSNNEKLLSRGSSVCLRGRDQDHRELRSGLRRWLEVKQRREWATSSNGALFQMTPKTPVIEGEHHVVPALRRSVPCATMHHRFTATVHESHERPAGAMADPLPLLYAIVKRAIICPAMPRPQVMNHPPKFIPPLRKGDETIPKKPTAFHRVPVTNRLLTFVPLLQKGDDSIPSNGTGFRWVILCTNYRFKNPRRRATPFPMGAHKSNCVVPSRFASHHLTMAQREAGDMAGHLHKRPKLRPLHSSCKHIRKAKRDSPGVPSNGDKGNESKSHRSKVKFESA